MFLNLFKRRFSFKYQNVFETKEALNIPYKKLTSDYVKTLKINN
jgi:hypothetical protein